MHLIPLIDPVLRLSEMNELIIFEAGAGKHFKRQLFIFCGSGLSLFLSFSLSFFLSVFLSPFLSFSLSFPLCIYLCDRGGAQRKRKKEPSPPPPPLLIVAYCL